MSNPISPCISVCKTDPETGFCYGCGRTEEEKSIWKEESTSSNWKNENLLAQQILEHVGGHHRVLLQLGGEVFADHHAGEVLG